MVEGAALEMLCGETHLGFESLTLRQRNNNLCLVSKGCYFIIVKKSGDYMITFGQIEKLFSQNLNGRLCIEIDFTVRGFLNYKYCWMGKMPDQSDKNKELYWFGLAEDGSKAHDFDNFFTFSTAPIFDGKSLKDVWDNVELFSIDGCDPEERIQAYLR